MKKTIVRNYVPFIFFLLLSCEENCDQPSCLPGPEGTIRANSINLTIFTLVNDMESITLIGTKEHVLSLDGLNSEQGLFFSTWHTIPDTDYTMAKVIIGGKPLEIAMANFPNTEQIQLEITEKNGIFSVRPSTFEQCDDPLAIE